MRGRRSFHDWFGRFGRREFLRTGTQGNGQRDGSTDYDCAVKAREVHSLTTALAVVTE